MYIYITYIATLQGHGRRTPAAGRAGGQHTVNFQTKNL